MLTHRIRENVFTLKAARLAGTDTPVFVTVHGPMGMKLDHLRHWKGRRRRAEVLRYYRQNRGIVAITQETAADLRTLLGADLPLTTIPNPIVTPALLALAQAPIDHPWFPANGAAPTVPVLVFAGRLEVEKDLPTLLRAFALLRQGRDCRLLIIGDGRLRPAIESECAALGLGDAVDLPGWVPNPYPLLRRAALVVLSSVWDALPTVLIEALALGTPVVSTECGAGPREILDGGRLGPLVPPGDAAALSCGHGPHPGRPAPGGHPAPGRRALRGPAQRGSVSEPDAGRPRATGRGGRWRLSGSRWSSATSRAAGWSAPSPTWPPAWPGSGSPPT